MRKLKKAPTAVDAFFVRAEGLEPPCLAASDPKSDMSTNFTTPGFGLAKIGEPA